MFGKVLIWLRGVCQTPRYEPMSSPLTFIPRKLTRPKSSLRPAIVSKNAEATSLPTAACPILTAKEKGKDRALDGDERVQHLGRTKTKQTTKFTDEDHASLVCLALSDYALWSDPDLRRRIDQGQLQTVAPNEKSGEGTGNMEARDEDAGCTFSISIYLCFGLLTRAP